MNKTGWTRFRSVATAAYRFCYEEGEEELRNKYVTFNYGDDLEVTHKNREWFCGRNLNTNAVGIFPASYVRTHSPQVLASQSNSSSLSIEVMSKSSSDIGLVLTDLQIIIREWILMLKMYFGKKDYIHFEMLFLSLGRLIKNTSLIRSNPKDKKVGLLLAESSYEISRTVQNLGLNVIVQRPDGRFANIIDTGIKEYVDLLHLARFEIGMQNENKANSQQLQQQQQRSMSLASSQQQQYLSQSQQQSTNTRVTSKNKLPSSSRASRKLPNCPSLEYRKSTSAIITMKKTTSSLGCFSSGGVSSLSNGQFQLYFEYKSWKGRVGSDHDIHVSLFDGKSYSYLSEDYVLQFTQHNQPKNKSPSITSSFFCTIFKDLELKDFNGFLFLVFKIILKKSKEGSSSSSSSKKKSSKSDDKKGIDAAFRPPRYPIACGVVPIEPDKVMFQKFTSDVVFYATEQPFIYPLIPKLIVDDEIESLDLATSEFCFEMELIPRQYCTLINEMKHFSDVHMTSKFSLPEVLIPCSSNQDMDDMEKSKVYITMMSGEFSEKNIEITVCVRTSKSKISVSDCIGTGSNLHESVVSTVILRQSNTPVWNETFVVNANNDMLLDMHAYFEIYAHPDAEKHSLNAFAFGFLPFGHDGHIFPDKEHNIAIFKGSNSKPLNYLKGLTETGKKLMPLKCEHMKVKLSLNSSKFPQNENLQSFMDWKKVDSIPPVLKKLTFVNPNEIVHHIALIFDNIFEILSSFKKNDVNIKDGIFSSMIFILGKLTESRGLFNYKPVLDSYIMESMRATDIHFPIMNELNDLLMKIIVEPKPSPVLVSKLANWTKVLDYLVKLIIISRRNEFLMMEQEKEQLLFGNQEVQSELLKFFKNLCDLMKIENASLVGPQVNTFRIMPFLLADTLGLVFGPSDLVDLCVDFLLSSRKLQFDKILRERLFLIDEVCKTTIMNDSSFQIKLLSSFCQELSLDITIAATPSLLGERADKIIERRKRGTYSVKVFSSLCDVVRQRVGFDQREGLVLKFLEILPTILELSTYCEIVESDRFIFLVNILAILRLLSVGYLNKFLDEKISFENGTKMCRILGGEESMVENI